jgi:hypothetical protein
MNFQHGKGEIGFVYYLEHVGVDGSLISKERIENIIPGVGRDYILSSSLMSGAQYATFYIGLHGTDYDPLAGDDMASLLAAVTETTEYVSATRKAMVPDALANGLFSNAGTPAVFEFNGSATVRGGFITSNSVKLNGTGLLLSAVLFPSPKVLATGESLKVTGGISLITA